MRLNESNIQSIPADDITQALNAINGGLSIIKPYLTALTPEDRRKLLKMADGTAPFVSKGAEFVDKGTIALPEFVNKQTLDESFGVYQSLVPVANALADFYSLVNDTRTLAGSNALMEVLGFYDYVKSASRRRVPGAKTIYDEMKGRYARKKTKKLVAENSDKAMEAVA